MLGQRVDSLLIGERLQEADQDRAFLEQLDLGGARLGDLGDDVGAEGFLGGDELGAGRFVRLVSEGGCGSRALLDDDLELLPGQFGDDLGDEGDTRLAGSRFLRDSDLHGAER